jgi:hypothetical protein
MIKKWGGWTANRWRKTLEWKITSHQFTTGSKACACFSWRRTLIHAGDWDTLPIDIKYNIQFYAFLYERTFPRMAEEHRISLEKRMERLEAEKQALIVELGIQRPYGRQYIFEGEKNV